MIAARLFACALVGFAVASSAAWSQEPDKPAAGQDAAASDESGSGEPKAKIEDFPKVLERLKASEAAQSAHRACPAEIWDTARPVWRRAWDAVVGDTDMKEGACDADPLACLTTCLSWRSANACFQTARTLQTHGGKADRPGHQALFAEACALGFAAGCTNRAAGLRNAWEPNDPLPAPTDPTSQNCAFRSFEVACREEDPWGCAMHGMSFQYGLGTGRDAVKAKAAFDKSCSLAPNFVACDMAKDQLAEMNAPDEKADAPEETPSEQAPK